MNKKILLAEVVLALFIILGFKAATVSNREPVIQSSRKQAYKGKMRISCSPDWNTINTDSLGNAMEPLPGWGNYSWKISTSSDSAQFYFNQGINMYYAFHIIEAMASFKKAAIFDNNNPMIYWAQALAYGPNINDFVYDASADALTASQKALELSANSGEKEKALINAMIARYSSDTTVSRKDLNQQYAAEMKKVFTRFNKDADVMALYADALLVLHPWEYWQHNGNAQPWTPEILATLEKLLKTNPMHPGGNHYYIHAVEASPNPARAMASADRLGKMMPDVSHMVHMPSHIYIRTGNYAKGIKVNDMAINGYYKYLGIYPEVSNNSPLYLIHNIHMKTACAMMQPNYKLSIKAAKDCVASFDSSFLSLPQPMGNFVQYVYMVTQMVNVRYGKWNEALAYPEVSTNYAFAFVLNKWAKGLAYANIGKIKEAKKEQAILHEKLSNADLQIRLEPFNKPYDQAIIAENILLGTIAQFENKLPEAITYFTKAVQEEDKLVYTEPRDWLIPTRQYLANVLIKSKQYGSAKKYLMEDLAINPNNFYSIAALEYISSQEANSKLQAQYKKQLNAVYTDSDLPFPALIY